MINIQALIFDLDNTLVDRSKTFSRFTQQLLNKYFQGITDETRRELASLIIHTDQDGYKEKQSLFTELLELLPWQVKPSVEELLGHYASHYVKEAVLMDNAAELLEFCSGRFKVGLVTNGKDAIQLGKLDKLQIRHYFDAIVISEGAGVKKPHAEIFEKVLRDLELPAEACIYIGDHPVNDIEGAAKAGMQTIWIKVNQPWQNELEAKPLCKVESLLELEHYLKNTIMNNR